MTKRRVSLATPMWLGCVLAILFIAGPALAVLQTVTSTSVSVVAASPRPQYWVQSITVGSYSIPVASLRTGTTTGTPDAGFSITSIDTFDLNDYCPRTAKTLTINTVYFNGKNFKDVNGTDPDFFVYEVCATSSTNWCDAANVRLKPILSDGTIPADAYRINSINNYPGGFVMDPANPTQKLLVVDGRTGGLNGQAIGGLSFSLTDMKDAAGNFLLPTAEIRGILIDSGNIDLALVCAVCELNQAVRVAPAEGSQQTSPVNLKWRSGYTGTGAVQYYYLYMDPNQTKINDPNRGDAAHQGLLIDDQFVAVPPVDPNVIYTYGGAIAYDTNYYWAVDTVVQEPRSPGDPNLVVRTYRGLPWLFTGPLSTPVLSGPADVMILPDATTHVYPASPSATFNVDITAILPVYSVSWYKEGSGTPLVNGAKYTITSSNTLTTLVVNNVDLTQNVLADNGKYYAVVTLSKGGLPSGSGESRHAFLHATQILRHRYSFSEAAGTQAADSIGGKHGTIKDVMTTGNYSWSGAELTLTNTGQSTADPNGVYVNLPNGMISALVNDATFMAWYTWQDPQAAQTAANNEGIYDFGVSTGAGGGEDQVSGTGRFVRFTPKADSGNIQFQSETGTNTNSVNDGAYVAGSEVCAAVVWDGTANQARLYIGGELKASGPLNQMLADLSDLNNWLGRRQLNDRRMYIGKFNELRIYDIPLSEPWIKAMCAAGPDVVSVNPCIDPSVYDFNGDCMVNLKDFAIFAQDWLHYGLLY